MDDLQLEKRVVDPLVEYYIGQTKKEKNTIF